MIYNSDCDTVGKLKFDLESFASLEHKRNPFKLELPSLKSNAHLPTEKKVVIIGSGLIGIGLAARASHLGFNNDLVILDKNKNFAQNFHSRTNQINQKVMRSPYTHHLAPNEDIGLADFGRLKSKWLTHAEKKGLELARKFERSLPALDIFMKHTEGVVRIHDLQEKAFQFNVESISRDDKANKWIIKNKNGKVIKSKYVILALGQGYNNDNIFKSIKASKRNSHRVVITGGGNTAGHLILDSIRKGHKVDWVIRDELRFLCSDVPHKYFREEGQFEFLSKSIEERKQLLDEKLRGSCMLEHFHLFKKFIQQGLLNVHQHTLIDSYQENDQGLISCKLSTGKTVTCCELIKAHGLKPNNLPNIDPPIKKFGDYPILNDQTLEAKNHPNLFVSSIHSSLSLGPAAKLIDGARLANEKIFKTILQKERKNNCETTHDYKIKRPMWGQITAVSKPTKVWRY
ncbi:hypothetical protein AAV35_013780 (plasmid) [Salimicrobium jeotgali]|uniref:FAD dependent oxidoreductase n=1 Tax=Salimicrobium jeotgali TaxID=1230341 RepID=K2GK31_9BACI|nr:NAD(P)-binding domain-containing protein [Salimicrobium jeotgali]AKG05838.1 hypothetical protein AAV35_013780 [Salimicrobium jeotgali]EKE30799.1 FAD dependent oxidoreductase [Salimicrobium jeotgali]MBM7697602.1 hypothetical protein [Salimicrobium jeotgali]